ncbi:adenylosuccinate lyase [uncultured Thermanaerothrix sp.]|uniref:adenylosuccinate lyase n=1 Tax=uncultured Thermanaerothrix sp. TaxID=1195149 RepID=UPI00262A8607|nr:adenylosuccinate lyase [uncultured Thermanaerothrix sp.]
MDHSSYQSPFSWRYGSPEMRALWSEHTKRRLWRKVWVTLAEAQAEFGLVTPSQVQDLRNHQDSIDLPRALEIEAEIQHDLMAELRTFAEQCPVGGKIIHLGATSMDIEDNAEALRLRQGLDLLIRRLSDLLLALTEKIEQYAHLPVIGYTHLQPAEPLTLGYRFALYAQDLFEDYQVLADLHRKIRGKGFKGAVGSAASYAELLGLENLDRFEALLSQKLDLPFYPIANQTYPRKQDFLILSALAGLGASIYKLAFDLRLLQNPMIGEWREPFGRTQVGSSAMPFKRNPIRAERINSLARLLITYASIAWQNAAHSLLERTLDDSANRRIILPEAFLTTDELLLTALTIVKGLEVDKVAIERNLHNYLPFAVMERVLMALVKRGADRQAMHEQLRQHALKAWQALQQGQANPLAQSLSQDEAILRYLRAEEITDLFQNAEHYVGVSACRAIQMADVIRQRLKGQGPRDLYPQAR